MKKYSLAHVYATLVGLIVILAGVFLFTFATSCGIGDTIYDYSRQKCLAKSSLMDNYYAYRPYGLALIVLGLIFIYGVYRSTSQQEQSEPNQHPDKITTETQFEHDQTPELRDLLARASASGTIRKRRRRAE